jgi:hypothetical protein
VNRIRYALDSAWHRIAFAVGEKCRDLPFVKQLNSRNMQACLALTIVAIVPRSKFKASSVMPGSKYKDVARSKLHTLSLFTLLQFVNGHRMARFQPLYAEQPWNIQENSSSNNSVYKS